MACSPEVMTKYTYKTIPDELLSEDCKAVRHGDGSVRELGKAYLNNTACLKKHQDVLSGAREYNKIMREEIEKNF